MLSIYRAGEIDLFENLDIVHIRLLVGCVSLNSRRGSNKEEKTVQGLGISSWTGERDPTPPHLGALGGAPRTRLRREEVTGAMRDAERRRPHCTDCHATNER